MNIAGTSKPKPWREQPVSPWWLAVFPFTIAGVVLLRGWATLYAWQCFAVPLGAPTIGFAHAAGIGAGVIGVVWNVRAPKVEPATTNGGSLDAVARSFSFPLWTLGSCAFWHWCML